MKLRFIWEFYNLGNRNNSCNFVNRNAFVNMNGMLVPNPTFGAPLGYCGGQGPGATFGNAYRSQFGFRFEF
jgi:hypothetical protein